MKGTLSFLILLVLAVGIYFFLENKSKETASLTEAVPQEEQADFFWQNNDPVEEEHFVPEPTSYQEEAEVGAESRLNEQDSLGY